MLLHTLHILALRGIYGALHIICLPILNPLKYSHRVNVYTLFYSMKTATINTTNISGENLQLKVTVLFF